MDEANTWRRVILARALPASSDPDYVIERDPFVRRLLPGVARACDAVGEFGLSAKFNDGSLLIVSSNQLVHSSR